MPTLTYGQKTDTGRIRKSNQDAFAVLEGEALEGHADGLFIVADGMGGRAGGETAARMAVDTVQEVAREMLGESSGLAETLREALIEANTNVFRRGRAEPDLRGMGTTCVAVLVRDGTAAVGHVGDSRVYLARGAQIQALTHDHSLVQEYVGRGEMSREEARGSRFRNVITRGIGLTSTVTPDVCTVQLQEGDTVLLCSDGLTGMLEDRDILRVLATEPDVQGACDRLVESANARGGRDNTTVVVLRYGVFAPAALPPGGEAELDTEGDGYEEERQRHRPPGSSSRGSSRRSRRSSPALVLLCLLLAAGLGYVTYANYEIVGGWPPLVKRTQPPPPPPKPVQRDLEHLQWGAPAALGNVQLRGAPLAAAGGGIYAATPNGKLVRISPDNGKSLGEFQRAVTPPTTTGNTHMAVDAAGYVYVSSKREHAIRRYNPQGTRVADLHEGLKAPEGIAVGPDYTIYVVDAGRLKVLRPTDLNAAPTPRPAASAGEGNAAR